MYWTLYKDPFHLIPRKVLESWISPYWPPRNLRSISKKEYQLPTFSICFDQRGSFDQRVYITQQTSYHLLRIRASTETKESSKKVCQYLCDDWYVWMYLPPLLTHVMRGMRKKCTPSASGRQDFDHHFRWNAFLCFRGSCGKCCFARLKPSAAIPWSPPVPGALPTPKIKRSSTYRWEEILTFVLNYTSILCDYYSPWLKRPDLVCSSIFEANIFQLRYINITWLLAASFTFKIRSSFSELSHSRRKLWPWKMSSILSPLVSRG